MKKPTTAQLIQDLVAIHFEVQRHVQDTRRRLTSLQIEVMAGSVTSLNRFLIAWQTATAGTKAASRPRAFRDDPQWDLNRATNSPVSYQVAHTVEHQASLMRGEVFVIERVED